MTIYEVHMYKRKEAWYRLSEKEQKELGSKLAKLPTAAGAKSILDLRRAMSGEWHTFGVYEYPDIETREKLMELYEEQQFFRYVEPLFVLGRAPSERREA